MTSILKKILKNALHYSHKLQDIDNLILPEKDGGSWLGYELTEDSSLFTASVYEEAFNGFFCDHTNSWKPCLTIQSHWLHEGQLALALFVGFACRWEDQDLDNYLTEL